MWQLRSGGGLWELEWERGEVVLSRLHYCEVGGVKHHLGKRMIDTIRIIALG